jgi:hypothetical protein
MWLFSQAWLLLSFSKLACSQLSFNQFVEIGMDVFGTATDYIGRNLGVSEACPFVEDPVESLHDL